MKEIYKQSFVRGLLISNLGNVMVLETGEKLYKYNMKTGYLAVLYKGLYWMVHLMVGHAFIDNPEKKPIIDHIDNNRLNNNVENLRWATSKENAHNRVLYKNNTSGYKGVYWNKQKNKWYAMICEDYKLTNLGYFDNKEDAILTRYKKAKEIMGEFINECEIIKSKKDDLDEDLEALELEFQQLIKGL